MNTLKDEKEKHDTLCDDTNEYQKAKHIFAQAKRRRYKNEHGLSFSS